MEKEAPNRVHHGRNMRYWRKMRDKSQKDVAEKMNVSQQLISKLEDTEKMEPDTLQKVAAALEIPVEAIKDFEADKPVNFIANKVEISDTSQPNFEHATLNPTSYNYYQYYNCTFIPRSEDDDSIKHLLKAIENKDIK